MNTQKLKEAEAHFLSLYPKGFEDEGFQPIIKKHNTAKIGELAQEMFTPDCFGQPERICENFTKIVSKSTLVSLFEKPKIRGMVQGMSGGQKEMLSTGLYELLYGKKEGGFEILVEALAVYKMAKWPIVTLIPYYYAREKEIFVKPTTTKDIIKTFELKDLTYKPRPTYAFYEKYKKELFGMKKLVNLSSEDNAAFTGFLMIGMKEK